jgi:DNA-binding response OmpR family regulator
MKILLVEDDPVTWSVLVETLISQNHSVDMATDKYSALERASSCAYDPTTLDIGIPQLDGISLCKRLRAKGCQSPILRLTAKDSSSDRVLGLDAGANDYVDQSTSESELVHQILRHLSAVNLEKSVAQTRTSYNSQPSFN